MSGDKLLGGPQAGLIVGDAKWIDAMRRNPLARSYRVDKLTLAALEATLALYREPARALAEIPTLVLLGTTADELRGRADALRRALTADGIDCEVVASVGSVGAGAFPDAELPGAAVALAGDAERWARRLRAGHDGRGAGVRPVPRVRLHHDKPPERPKELPELARAVVDARE
jgi:L-seryl-tRNA(Ser) seleniumtransferase